MTKSDPTRQTYDQHACQIADRFWAVDLSYLWARFLEMLAPNAQILDLGCGAGRDASHFADRGFSVTGADLSMGMLLEAARRAPGAYLQADMTALPFPSACFDAVWANASLLHLPRELAPGVLTGVFTLLKPRGILYLSLKIGEGAIWEEREGRRFFVYYQTEEVFDLLANAGFTLKQQWTEPAKSFDWLNTISRKP